MNTTDTTTITLTGQHVPATAETLGNATTDKVTYTVTIDSDSLTASVTFKTEDADKLKAHIAKVKDADTRTYLRNGGNPRNKRAISSRYSKFVRAIDNA